DGLLVGGLALVLGMAALVWTATGLAGLFAHGAWPDGVSFTNTPTAIRELIGEPHDMAGAWPETPRGQLTGYGLFWGLFIGQVLVLVVLTVFVLGTASRWRAVRQARRLDRDRDRAHERRDRRERDRATERADWADPDAGEPGGTRGVEEPEDTENTRREAGGAEAHESSPWPVSLAKQPTATPPAADPHTGSSPNSGSGLPDRPYDTPDVLPGPTLGVPGADPGPASGRYGLRIAPDPTAAAETVREAEGAVLAVTADIELYAETVGARAKLGPVHVYDPGQRTDAPSRLRWEPHAGCADLPTAQGRASALLAPLCASTSGDPAVHDAARTLLRCFLHAAAIAGEPFRQVHRWTASGSSKNAVRILRTHREAGAGTAGELEATLTAYPERREAALELVRRSLQCLSQLHVRDACTAGRADRVAWDSFIPEGGTLFVVGERLEAPRREGPGAMGLVTAVTAATIEHGRRLAAQAHAGRLDPPLTVLLDQAATVAPLPRLPELLADGPDAGLRTIALLRSTEQARAWWPELAR
ncbi:type IV secretory system conjugative DNA transfer family protein, partial [Streptomyces oceani]